ncbi:MAG: hypothetical protein K2X57_03390 [Xanthobacteraceae bacterium]|nr:hypothetical protein [Xanthobacteraceae bacterium]
MKPMLPNKPHGVRRVIEDFFGKPSEHAEKTSPSFASMIRLAAAMTKLPMTLNGS